ncbi:MAG: hypothetical protein ACM3JH_02485 [Acidithiobacillales bacterium]
MSGEERAGREFLRHTVATLAYRGAKAIRGAPPAFSGFKASPTTRTPGEVLAHLSDLLDWALRFCKGEQRWTDSAVREWEADSRRFFEALASLDAYLASGSPVGAPAEKLFQGPIADALTHVGQIAMLRRMAGAPIRGENYFRADIAAGTVGPDQPEPRFEFD